MNCPPGLSVYSPDEPFAPSPELGLGASFGSNGQVRWAQSGAANMGTLKTAGTDLNVRTNLDFVEAGRLSIDWQVRRILPWKVDSAETTTVVVVWPRPRASLT